MISTFFKTISTFLRRFPLFLRRFPLLYNMIFVYLFNFYKKSGKSHKSRVCVNMKCNINYFINKVLFYKHKNYILFIIKKL